jgi:hypothetical protein
MNLNCRNNVFVRTSPIRDIKTQILYLFQNKNPEPQMESKNPRSGGKTQALVALCKIQLNGIKDTI